MSIGRFGSALRSTAESWARFAKMTEQELLEHIGAASDACREAEAHVAASRTEMADQERKYAEARARLQRQCAVFNTETRRALNEKGSATKALEKSRQDREAARAGAAAGATTDGGDAQQEQQQQARSAAAGASQVSVGAHCCFVYVCGCVGTCFVECRKRQGRSGEAAAAAPGDVASTIAEGGSVRFLSADELRLLVSSQLFAISDQTHAPDVKPSKSDVSTGALIRRGC